jgi:hypothetical protein
MTVPGGRASGGGGDGRRPTSESRWWVEHAKVNEKERRAAARAAFAAGQGLPKLPGAKFFRVGMDFDQEKARSELTDTNLNLLRQANPPENGWAYLALIADRSSEQLVQRVKRSLRLPPGARGVIVDSGSSLRAIITGLPVGERVVEVTLAEDSSLDAWAHGEWVCEKVFANRERALREASALIASCLRNQETLS